MLGPHRNAIVARSSVVSNRRSPVLLFLRDVFVIIAVAVLVSFLVKMFLVRSFYIPSGSMSPTLVEDDRILVNELVPDIAPLQRGDVIVFRDPGGWLPTRTTAPSLGESLLGAIGLTAPDSDEHLVKRIIGLPGDRVICCNSLGQVTVNDAALDEPYIARPTPDAAASAIEFDRTVPDGFLWVMGDNRYASADSRYHQDSPSKGFVPIDNVVGTVFTITWPIQNWTWLQRPSDTFNGVPEPRPQTLPAHHHQSERGTAGVTHRACRPHRAWLRKTLL